MTRAHPNFFEQHKVLGYGLLFVGVVLVTVVVDIIARKILDKINLGHESTIRIESRIYHHGFQPNAEGTIRWGKAKYSAFTNSLGFLDARKREVPLHTEKYRVVFIGDSFTEGVGYPYPQTFVGLLHSRFADIEILNAAAVSYSPIIYYRKMKHFIEDVGLTFDELVVCLDISDIWDENWYYLDSNTNQIRERPANRSLGYHPPFIRRIIRKVFDSTVLMKSLYDGLVSMGFFRGNPLTLEATKSLWTISKTYYEGYGRTGLEKSAQHLSELAHLLHDKGIHMTLMVYPWPDQIYFEDLHSRQVTYWQAWTAQQNVRFVNLFPHFIGQRPAREILDTYFIRDDIHWNEEGHRLVAKVLAQELLPTTHVGLGSPSVAQ